VPRTISTNFTFNTGKWRKNALLFMNAEAILSRLALLPLALAGPDHCRQDLACRAEEMMCGALPFAYKCWRVFLSIYE